MSAIAQQPGGPQPGGSVSPPSAELPPVVIKTEPETPPKRPKPKVAEPPKGSVPAAAVASPAPATTQIAVADPQPAATGPANPGIIASGFVAPPKLASEMTFSGAELATRPVTRPGEVLEAAPGLIVTQHSGEGKANQYFLRGYNLDHGTDLAIFVDDVPINLRTHAHGQGYADLNWLIPELVASVDVRKGPYFVDQGDFATTGSLRIGLIDGDGKSLASGTVGSFGYARALAITSARVAGGHVLAAGEVATYSGPWTNPDDVQKLNFLARYSQGDVANGFSITGMAYANRWNSTDQVPERAITTGQIGRFDAEDPTDGGKTSRFSLSGRLAISDASGSWKGNAYVVRSKLDLFNNFTYFLANPELGDQFHQRDDRVLAGGSFARLQKGTLLGLPMETTAGVETRYDAIDLGLTDTHQRSFLSNVRSDKVGEGSVGFYVDNTVHWTSWLRSTLGWRGDYFAVDVNSIYDAANSGKADAFLGSPKFSAVIGPFAGTELFLGAGFGMHSNDARGVTITEAPTDPTSKLSASPLLVRTKGAEVGLRSKLVPGLDTTVSLFAIDQDSEIVFSGDAGDTSASRPSRRYGIEWTGKYHPVTWLTFDGEVALSHARFLGTDNDQADTYAALSGFPQAQIGNAPGNYIPNAPAVVAAAGITLGEQTGWFGGLRWRYLGSSPLTEDNAFRSIPTSVFNGRVGYRTADGWTAQLDALNLFNTKTNQITYGYGSFIRTDNLFNLCFPVQVAPAAVCQAGVTDRIVHPIEPFAVRFTLSKTF